MAAVSGGGLGAALRYDPLGRLYELTDTRVGGGTVRMLNDGPDLVAEYDTSGTLLRRYAHGPGNGDNPIAWYEGSAISSATRRFLLADRLGSIVAVADNGGTSIATNTYDEYGIPGSGGLGRFRYTGQTWLPEAGIYHYKARMYSPTLGRFLQTDPIGYADGMNMYAYVGGDPVNWVDPTGMCSVRTFALFRTTFNLDGTVRSKVRLPGTTTVEKTGQCKFGEGTNHILILGMRPRRKSDGLVEQVPQSGPCAAPGPRNVLNKAIAEANAKRLDSLRRINEAIRNFGTKEAYPIVQGIHIETSLWFADRVRTGGAWDFKNQPGTRGNQDFGNFAFGATAEALGYGDFGHVGADLYSLWENGTFEDQDALINAGQAYYRNGCGGR